MKTRTKRGIALIGCGGGLLDAVFAAGTTEGNIRLFLIVFMTFAFIGALVGCAVATIAYGIVELIES